MKTFDSSWSNLIFIGMLVIAIYLFYLTLISNPKIVNAALIGEMTGVIMGNFIAAIVIWVMVMAFLNYFLSIFTKKLLYLK